MIIASEIMKIHIYIYICVKEKKIKTQATSPRPGYHLIFFKSQNIPWKRLVRKRKLFAMQQTLINNRLMATVFEY